MSIDPGPFELNLSGNLSLRTIAAHHASLLSALSENKFVSLAMTDDVQADLSFLQLVESARVFAATAGRTLTLAKPAEGALRDLLERAGFLHGMSPVDAQFWLHQGDLQ